MLRNTLNSDCCQYSVGEWRLLTTVRNYCESKTRKINKSVKNINGRRKNKKRLEEETSNKERTASRNLFEHIYLICCIYSVRFICKVCVRNALAEGGNWNGTQITYFRFNNWRKQKFCFRNDFSIFAKVPNEPYQSHGKYKKIFNKCALWNFAPFF